MHKMHDKTPKRWFSFISLSFIILCMSYEARNCHYELYIRKDDDEVISEKNKNGCIHLEHAMNTINWLFYDISTAEDM
jgi:hypothetical protein